MGKKKLVTIVTEAVLESKLVDDLGRFGAKGFTIMEARGSGTSGVRDADWDQNRNIKIEIICDEQIASLITEHCRKEYYSNYAMVIYLTKVEILRPGKF